MRRAFSHTGQMSPENEAIFGLIILIVGFFVFFPWSGILLLASPFIILDHYLEKGKKNKE